MGIGIDEGTQPELIERTFILLKDRMARTTGSDGKKTAQAIRDKCTELFAQHSYAAVSMRMIAEAVGVQVSALYNHYPTKQAILVDLLTTHMENLLSAWDAHLPSGADPLEDFARFHIRFHLTKPDAVFLSYMELRSLDAENFEALDILRNRYEAILIEILQTKDLKNAKITAMAILGMLTGTTTWYKPDGQLSPAEIEDIYARLVLNCVGTHERTAAHV